MTYKIKEVCKGYAIDTDGVVWSEWRQGGQSSKLTGIWRPLKSHTEKIRTKYRRITLGKKGAMIHRLLAEAFIPNPNNYPLVLHKDDDPANNSLENLYWGTIQDNANDRKKNRRAKKIKNI